MTITNISLVDKVVERLKTQPVGDLITEEDLHDIVKQAIPKAFFESRDVGSGYDRKTIPAPIIAILSEALKGHVEKAVKQWVVENHDLIEKHWRQVMDDGITRYALKAIDSGAASHVNLMLQQWISNMNQERQRQGLPPMF